jgi:glycosyltransferase involved in cell wall biosynthesis
LSTFISAENGRAPRRLLFVITGLMTGGAEMMLLKLCSRLDASRFAPAVVSLSDKGTMGPRIEALGVPVHALGLRAGVPSPASAWRLRELISSLSPDLVQGWMYHGNVAASLLGGRRPVVWGIRQSLYGLATERRLTRWVIRASALLSSRPTAILYNSRTSAGQHESFGFDASLTQVIPNGFDTDMLRPDAAVRTLVRRELGVGDTTLLIGMVGRYHPMKDHGAFLRAASLLSKELPDARFVLAGNRVDAANRELVAMAEEAGVRERVFLLGERADVARLYPALDIASSTSAWGEGFANVIGEAMSCGVPCVVTDVGDSAWIVGATGRVVPARDPAAMAKAWSEWASLAKEQRQLMGGEARRRVVEEFSLGAVVKRYEDLYESLLARASV